MSYRRINVVETGAVLAERARWCNSYFSRMRGFTWRRRLEPTDALVLVDSRDGIISSSITMLFVFFDLGVIWINGAGEVVDKVIARPWRPQYAAQAPARYVVELPPALLDQVNLGDHIRFEEV